jgi:hypothetical protein
VRRYEKHLADVESVETGMIAYNRRYNLPGMKKANIIIDGK